jgi:hypothetical protein
MKKPKLSSLLGVFLTGVCNQLVSVLDRTNTPDDERRAILERFLNGLRTEDPYHLWDEGRFLVLDIADKHGLQFYVAPVEEELRKMRARKEPQAAPAPVQASATSEESERREDSAGPPEAHLREEALPRQAYQIEEKHHE